jgi:hypothetical protein
VQPLSLELKPALTLGGVIQQHLFEITESAAPAYGTFQAPLQTPVARAYVDYEFLLPCAQGAGMQRYSQQLIGA